MLGAASGFSKLLPPKLFVWIRVHSWLLFHGHLW